MKKNGLVSGIVFGALTLVPMAGWSQSSGQTPGPSGAGSSQPGSSDTSTRGGSSTDTSTRGSNMSSMPSSSASSGQWSREDVKSVQEALKGKGHNPGPIDGVMGPQTQQALRAFQRSQKIQQSGQLDSSTASALGVQLSEMGAGSSSTGSGSAQGTGSSNRGSSTDSGSPSGSGTSTRGSSGSGMGAGTGSAPGSSGSSVNK